MVELVHEGGVPRDYYRIPIGVPDVKRPGRDLTIVTVGATLYRALEAADRLAGEFGLEAEVIDARSLVPFPVTVVGARNWITPPVELGAAYFPQPEWLLDAVHRGLRPLPGYTPSGPGSRPDRIAGARLGI